MKKIKLSRFGIAVLAILFAFSTSNCHVHTGHSSKSIPPGQAKKASGSKSAKQYAPGQNK